MRSPFHLAIVCCLALSACSSGEAPPHLFKDGAVTLPDYAIPDGAAMPDLFPPVDVKPDSSCTLGTTQACAHCSDVCPPGNETSSTSPVCIDSKCDIQCKGEYYDVDGDAKNGCEAQDDLPVHSEETLAKSLGKVKDCDNNQSAAGVIPSDARKHITAPVDRTNGRADWFKLHIDDQPGCIVNAEVKVSLSGLPAAASYRVVAHYLCDKDSKKLAPDNKLGQGGTELTLAPGTGCTLIGDDSGWLYIKVSKESGPHSKASYAIDIEP